MTRRPAVTLMEVLIAMFIMAIGMLALMALFPVGAVSMAQALKDDRCAYASTMANTVAIVNNVRYGDANVAASLATSSSGLVYVDPYAAQYIPILPTLATLGGLIPRTAPSFVYYPLLPTPVIQPSLIDRWFSIPDDISYTWSSTANVSNTGGVIDRGRRYSFAYLLRQTPVAAALPTQSMKAVQLYAVVYSGRPVTAPTLETTLPVVPPSGVAGTNGIVINAVGATIKRGGWILDPVNGYFYRVTNLAELGTTTTIEVQQSLNAAVTFITIMDNVAEVFDKGFGWQQ